MRGVAGLAAVAVILWRRLSIKRRKRGAKLKAVSELPGGINNDSGDAIRRSSLQVQSLSHDSKECPILTLCSPTMRC